MEGDLSDLESRLERTLALRKSTSPANKRNIVYRTSPYDSKRKNAPNSSDLVFSPSRDVSLFKCKEIRVPSDVARMATRVRAPRFIDSGLFQHTLCLEYVVLFENGALQAEWKKKYNRGDYTFAFHGTTFANGISIGSSNFDLGKAKNGFFFSKWVPIALKYSKADEKNRYPVLVAKIAGKFSATDTFWKIMDNNIILPKCILIYCPENLIEQSMKKPLDGMHDSDAEL